MACQALGSPTPWWIKHWGVQLHGESSNGESYSMVGQAMGSPTPWWVKQWGVQFHGVSSTGESNSKVGQALWSPTPWWVKHWGVQLHGVSSNGESYSMVHEALGSCDSQMALEIRRRHGSHYVGKINPYGKPGGLTLFISFATSFKMTNFKKCIF